MRALVLTAKFKRAFRMDRPPVVGNSEWEVANVRPHSHKLRMLNNAASLNDLRIPPANRLEKLAGHRSGQYSIRINDQRRVCFEWRDSDAYNVEITDYHQGVQQ